VGRKSRAKAERRAERSRVAIQSLSSPTATTRSQPAAHTPVLAAAGMFDPQDSRGLPPYERATAGDHLRSLVTKHRELLGEIDDEVRRLLTDGHSWTVVGRAIGLSRQGARQRYRHLLADHAARLVGGDSHARGEGPQSQLIVPSS
jgi:hypothetical protein